MSRLFGGDRDWRLSPLTLGLVVVGVVVVVLLALVYQKPIRGAFAGGEIVSVEFPENYRGRLVDHVTPVKIAGVEVGKVRSSERTAQGTTMITMNVDADMAALGTTPSATVRPKTVLGGGYYVELIPGGGGSFDPSTPIPVQRTTLPVDLDTVLDTLPGGTRGAVQRVIGQADTALDAGARDGLRGVLTRAPATLEPAGVVLDALQGTRKKQDLPELVTNLQSMASVVAARQPAVDSIVTDLDRTTATLAKRAGALQQTVQGLPDTLRETREGLKALEGTLDRLEKTAPDAQPTAKELAKLLRELDPLLDDLKPLLGDLKPLLRDARPLVKRLVPTSEHATSVLGDLEGPVLDRVNGPVLDTVLNPWVGTGPYAGNPHPRQKDHKFYEELGYLVVNLDRASMVQDSNGSTLNFQAGANSDSPSLGGISFSDFLKGLACRQGQQQPSGIACLLPPMTTALRAPATRAALPVPALPGAPRVPAAAPRAGDPVTGLLTGGGR